MAKASVRLGTAAKDRIKQLNEMVAEPEKHQPVPIGGLIDLNRIINGGLPRSKPFYVSIIGREKRGKSTVGLQLFQSYCEQTGLKGCLYDLEEVVEEAADRAMTMRAARTTRNDIYQLRLNDDNFEELNVIADEIDEHNVYVNDEIYDLEEIFKDARANGFKVICIDNFQLLDGGKGKDQRERLEYLSKALMRARGLGLRIFLLSQGSPDEKGSFGSSQVLKDANLVILIDNAYEGGKKKGTVMPGIRILRVILSRFSGTGECEVIFEGQFSRVRSVQAKKLESKTDFFSYELDSQEEDEILTGDNDE